jgi:hypothetical protein
MNPVRLSCDGVAVGGLTIPPFQLRGGEVACLHLPVLSWQEEAQLVQALTGEHPVSGIHRFGRVCWARPARNMRRGLFGLFRPGRAVDWLRRSAGVSRAEAEAVVERLGLRREWRVCQLAGNPRLLLGLEAAWARGADVVVFSTVGCDPAGVRAAFEAVARRGDRGAAVYLSYLYSTQGRMERSCPPGAKCIEVVQQAGDLAAGVIRR